MLTLLLIFALPWWAGVTFLFLPHRRRPLRSWTLAVAQGVGLVTLAVFPAACLQPFAQRSTTFDSWETLLPIFAVPGVHAGGLVARSVFEPLAESGVFGHRTATMLSNWPLFWTLSMALTLAVAALLATRLRRRDRARLHSDTPRRIDPIIALVLVGCLLNALLNVRWPWWGT